MPKLEQMYLACYLARKLCLRGKLTSLIREFVHLIDVRTGDALHNRTHVHEFPVGKVSIMTFEVFRRSNDMTLQSEQSQEPSRQAS